MYNATRRRITLLTGSYEHQYDNQPAYYMRWFLFAVISEDGRLFGYELGYITHTSFDERGCCLAVLDPISVIEAGTLADLIEAICCVKKPGTLRALYEFLKSMLATSIDLIVGENAREKGLEIVRKGWLGAQFSILDEDTGLILSSLENADLGQIEGAITEFEGVHWYEFAQVVLRTLGYSPGGSLYLGKEKEVREWFYKKNPHIHSSPASYGII